MLLANSHTDEVERRAAPRWAATIWNGSAPPEVVPFHQPAAPEPLRLVTFYGEDEAQSVDDVWTGWFSVAVVVLMALYMAGHFIAAWAAGRL